MKLFSWHCRCGLRLASIHCVYIVFGHN